MLCEICFAFVAGAGLGILAVLAVASRVKSRS